jgi:hypothetical protein
MSGSSAEHTSGGPGFGLAQVLGGKLDVAFACRRRRPLDRALQSQLKGPGSGEAFTGGGGSNGIVTNNGDRNPRCIGRSSYCMSWLQLRLHVPIEKFSARMSK